MDKINKVFYREYESDDNEYCITIRTDDFYTYSVIKTYIEKFIDEREINLKGGKIK